MQYKGEMNNSQAPASQRVYWGPFDGQRPVDSQLPTGSRKRREDVTVCSCCVEDLAKLIRCEFRRGDPIGITFIGDQYAIIFVGIFLALEGVVLVVKDLFLDRTISFIPLCDIASIEMGCALEEAARRPMLVTATPPVE